MRYLIQDIIIYFRKYKTSSGIRVQTESGLFTEIRLT